MSIPGGQNEVSVHRLASFFPHLTPDRTVLGLQLPWRFARDAEPLLPAGWSRQHTLTKASVSLNSRGSLHGLSFPIKGWLFQVARNRCLDELRKRRRRPEVRFSIIEQEGEEKGWSLLEAEPLPEEMTESIELHVSLQAAIVCLPAKFRSIVHLRCFRQLTFAEISRTLNMPEATVKTYFYRSLPFLR
jgi:RNA polymerase sigma factor (sigma-70 family)